LTIIISNIRPTAELFESNLSLGYIKDSEASSIIQNAKALIKLIY